MTLYAIALGVTLGVIVAANGVPLWFAVILTALTAWVVSRDER